MKKKTVRKVTGTKKVVPKSPQKKRFSLKAWLLGGLVLLVALAYGYSQSQPKGIKYLEVAGELSDYVSGKKIDINAVVINSRTTIKSDSPEVNAYVAATQAKQNAIKAGKDPVEDAEEIEQRMNSAAQQAARDTYQQAAATGVISADAAIKAVNGEDKVRTPEDAGNTESDKAASVGVTYAKEFVQIDKTGTITVVPPAPTVSKAVGNGTPCTTKNGLTVNSGETMIGNVHYDNGVSSGVNEIRGCQNGTWTLVCLENGTGVNDVAIQAGFQCQVSVKPTYLQETGKGNCFDDNQIIGYGSIIERDGKAKQCSGTGELIEVQKSLSGKYLTQDEINKLKSQCEDPKTGGGKWDNDKYICEGGQRAKELADAAKKYDEDRDACAKKGSSYEWISATGECKEKSKTGKTTEDCRAQGNIAVCRVYDENNNLINSRQSNITENCLPRGTETYCTQTVTDSTGKVIELRSYKKEGSINKVNPSGTYQNGEYTYKESDCIYGGEPTGTGSNQGAQFRCKDSTGAVPRSFNASATADFGNSSVQPEIISKDTHAEAMAECESLVKKNGGGNCLEQGVVDGKTVINYVPPASARVGSSHEFEEYAQFSNNAECRGDSNFSGSSMECVKTPDGKWTQVPHTDPNLDCNWFRSIILQPACKWKEITSNEQGNSNTSTSTPTKEQHFSANDNGLSALAECYEYLKSVDDNGSCVDTGYDSNGKPTAKYVPPANLTEAQSSSDLTLTDRLKCSANFLLGPLGLPSYYVCTTDQESGPISVPEYVTAVGSLDNGAECDHPGQCKSGYCRPNQWFDNSNCGNPPKEEYFSQQVSKTGKFMEGINCTDSSQCDEGLFCQARSLAADKCAPISEQLEPGDMCYTYLYGKDKLCSNCPKGYVDSDDTSSGSSYSCK